VPLPEGLWLRVTTAAALLAGLLAALLLLEARQLALLLGIAVALAGHEWGRLVGLERRGALGYAALCAALFGLAAAAGFAAPNLPPALFAASALFWLLLAPAWLRRGLGAGGRLALSAAGVVVLVPTAMAVLLLPPDRLLLLLGLVWIADTAAYFAGRAFGRRLLAPTISPGKTWEGVAGALAATLIYAIICAVPGAPFAEQVRDAAWVPYLGGAVLLCALSIVGDLFESALKRRAGAKDSGKLLPGHGGILDRIDSMTSSLPLAALLLAWLRVA
jgi:phosphatidate cytidylyltransferase